MHLNPDNADGNKEYHPVTASDRIDVAIAGGSATGLALALALARCLGPDLSIAVIDRGGADHASAVADTTVSDPRAVSLSAASRHMLEALGVWPMIAADAEPVRRIEITDSGLDAGVRPVLLAWDNDVATAMSAQTGHEPAAHIVPLPALTAALARAVAAERSIRVVRPVEVTGLATDGFAARLALRHPDGTEAALAARLAVAADGQRSVLRQAAGIKVVGWPYDQIGIAVTIAHEREHGGVAVQHFLPAGPFAILPLTGRRSCITWTEAAREGRRIMALDDADFLAEVDRRFGGKLGALSLAGGRRAWPLHMHLARAWVADRLVLVGDAAHSVHPIAGQGLNQAFRDVAALVQVVAETARAGLDIGDGTALGHYQQWRRFDAMTAAASFDAINRLFSVDGRLLRSAREVGLQVVDRLPGLKRALVAEGAGLAGDVPRLLKGELV